LADPTSIQDAIRENATGPKRVSSDGITVEQHDVKDQIAAEKHQASKQAAQAKGLGIKLAKISPGGTV
jgi:hypothetical protein